MGKKRKFFWILIGIGCALVFILFLVSTVIDVGQKLSFIKGLDYAFYAIVVLLFYLLIVNPVRIILFSPSFSVQTVLDVDSRKNTKLRKKVAKGLLQNSILDQMDADKIREAINQKDALKDELNRVLNSTVKKELNKIVMRNAKSVLLSTAISQNGKLDALTVVTINLKMIKELVLKCGFRPSYPNLGKLSASVFATALIADGLENLKLEDILPASSTNILAEIPIIKPLISSIMQGISNALLTIRIGIVTRKYLFADAGALSKNEIRIQALKESLLILPQVIADTLTFFPSNIRKLFNKKPKEEESVAA